MKPRTQNLRRGARMFVVLLAVVILTLPLSASATNRKLVGRPEFYSYRDAQISPDSRTLVFTAVEEQGGDPGLYSKPIRGGAAIQLNQSLGADTEIRAYAISPDSNWVLYLLEQSTDDVYELYKVPIAGPAGDSVSLFGGSHVVYIGGFLISSDGRWIVFTSDAGQDGDVGLFRVSIDGGAATMISGPMVSGGDVDEYEFSPDGSWVVYIADQDADGYDELYSVPLMGTSELATKLNHDIRHHYLVCMPSGDIGRDAIESFKISPSSGRVVYMAETAVSDSEWCDEIHELFSAPIDGSAAAVQIQDSLDQGGYDAKTYQISPNSDRVVYLYEEERVVDLTTYHVNELYSVSIQGPPGAAIKLHPTLAIDRDVEDNFKLNPTHNTVVYVADPEEDGRKEIYSVPIEGGTPTKLNDLLLSNAKVDRWNYELTPDGNRLVFAVDMGRSYPDYALFSVPAMGPGSAAVEISGPMAPGGAVYAFITRFKISPNGQRVVYRGDQDSDEVYELYSVPVAGPQGASVKLSGPMPPGGDVDFEPSYQFSPDSQWVIYVADQETDGVSELFISGDGDYLIYLPLIVR